MVAKLRVARDRPDWRFWPGVWFCVMVEKQKWTAETGMTQPKQCGGLGFRGGSYVQWSSRWFIFLCYHRMRGALPPRYGASFIKEFGILKQGLICRIGNGNNTKILEDNRLWRDEWLLSFRARQQTSRILVSELIERSSFSWNMEILQANFLPVDVQVTRSILEFQPY